MATLTEDDFVDFNEIILGRTLWAMRGLALVAAVGGLALTFLARLPELGFGVFGASVFLLVAFSRWGLRWQIRRKSRGVVGTQVRAVLDDEAVEASNAGMVAKLPWSSVTRARDDGRTFVLMRDRVIFGWFTRRTLDDATKSRVLALVARHVPDFG